MCVPLFGEVTEWPIVRHWKCRVPQGTAGSNPALSVRKSQGFTPREFLIDVSMRTRMFAATFRGFDPEHSEAPAKWNPALSVK